MLFILTACKNEVKVELPFEEEKVISILGDMHFAKVASKIHLAEKRDSMRLIYEAQVYEIYKITNKDFNKIKFILESDLDLYYDIEKKVHKYLKTAQSDKK